MQKNMNNTYVIPSQGDVHDMNIFRMATLLILRRLDGTGYLLTYQHSSIILYVEELDHRMRNGQSLNLIR